jgi:hypothetical protein
MFVLHVWQVLSRQEPIFVHAPTVDAHRLLIYSLRVNQIGKAKTAVNSDGTGTARSYISRPHVVRTAFAVVPERVN